MKLTNFLLCVLLSFNLSIITAASERDPALNNSLIYSYDEMFNFDIEAYLANQAPHLLPYSEVISHWSGYSSISPKVLLALIEQQSSLLTQQHKSAVALDRPLENCLIKPALLNNLRTLPISWRPECMGKALMMVLLNSAAW